MFPTHIAAPVGLKNQKMPVLRVYGENQGSAGFPFWERFSMKIHYDQKSSKICSRHIQEVGKRALES